MRADLLIPEKLAFDITEAAAAAGVPVNAVAEAVEDGRLPVRYATPKEFVVLRRDLVAWVDSLPEFGCADQAGDKDRLIRELQQKVNDLEHQILSGDPFLPIGQIYRHSVCVAPSPSVRQPKHLYFMRCEGHIKIGVSQNPRQRLAQIRGGSSIPPIGMDYRTAELVHVVSGQGDQERILHSKFAHLRAAGEWFTEAPELTEYINRLDVAA